MRTVLVLLAVLAVCASTPVFAFDAQGVALGASESAVKQHFPGVRCKPLEWKSIAADRRCDDPHAGLAGVAVRITFYLKKDAVQAFDVLFSPPDADRIVAALKADYGKPFAETDDKVVRGDKTLEFHKVRWEKGRDRALLVAPRGKGRAILSVSRGDFDQKLYRVP